jgi:hypothetical protein
MIATIDSCKIIDLPKITARQGNITFVEDFKHVPFSIERVYYIYDVPGGEERGAHAHIELQQILVSAMGAFDIILDDGISKKTFRMDRAYYGLLMPQMIWREIVNFSSGGICLVLASMPYQEDDYIRNYDQFLELKKIQ